MLQILQKINNINYFLLLILLNLQIIKSLRLVVTPLNTELNSITDYTISLDRFVNSVPDQSVPQGSYILIIFPSSFVLPTNSTCLATQWFTTAPTIPTLLCRIQGQTLRVDGGFPDSRDNVLNPQYIFTATSIRNPDQTGYSDGIDARIYTSTNVLLDQAITLYQVNMTESQFDVCTLTPFINKVNTITTLLISVKPKNDFPPGGYIIINFPSQWSNNPVQSQSGIIANLNNISCQNGNNTLSTIQCQYFTGSSPYIKVSQLNTVELNSLFTFNFSSIINPPSTEQTGYFRMASFSSSNHAHDLCQNIPYKVDNPNTFSPATFIMDAQVNTDAQGVLRVTLATPVTVLLYSAQIIFPSEILTSKISTIYGLQCWGRTYQSYIKLGNQINFQSGNFFNTLYNQGQVCDINFVNLTAPPSTKPTQSIQFTTFRNGFMVDQIISGLSLVARKGTIISAYVQADNSQISVTTTYSITINPRSINYIITRLYLDSLKQSGAIIIVFPNTIQIFPRVNSPCSAFGTPPSNPILSTVNCTVIGQQLTVQQLFSSDFNVVSNQNWSITIKVPNVINYNLTSPSQPFYITTKYDSEMYDVDDSFSQNISFSATQGLLELTTINVWADSYQVGATTTYYISFIAKNGLYRDGYIIIELPAQIKGVNVLTVQASCRFQNLQIQCEYINQNINGLSQIKFISIPQDYPKNTQINLTLINSIINPPSTKPYNSFTIRTFDKNNYIIDGISNSIQISMSQTTDFQEIQVNSNNQLNGAISTYQFSLRPTLALYNNYNLFVTFPTELVLPLQVVCHGISSNLQINLQCVKNVNTIQITLNLVQSTIFGGELFTFTIQNITNWISKMPTSNFQFLTTEDNVLYKINQRINGPQITNLYTATITQFTGVPFLSEMGATSQWTFTFNSVNQIPSNGLIKLTIPQDMSINSSLFQCSNYQGITSLTSNCSFSGREISIYALQFSLNQIGFQISGLKHPFTQQSNLFKLETFQMSNNIAYSIDMNDFSVKFVNQCNLPCRGCEIQNLSSCLSCYSDGSIPGINGLVLYFIQQKTCISICQNKFFQLNSQCLPCSTSCKNCFGSANVCTSCQDGMYLYNNTCTNLCPNQYWGDSSQVIPLCVSCQTPCENCQNTAINCTLCQLGKFMYQSICLDVCPLTSTITNTNTRTCDACILPCLKCVDSVRRCTLCVNGYYLLNNQCFSTCPAPNLPDITEGTCSSCKSPCQTCSVIASNCTSCSVNYYFENKCVTTCNGSYYADVTLMQCNQCSDQCETCTSSNICTSCVPDSNIPYLEGGMCVNICQQGYFANPDLRICQICISPCQTCISEVACLTCLNSRDNNKVFLLLHTCIEKCPPRYVPVGYECQQCDPTCSDCYGSPNNCTSCDSMYYYSKDLGTCSLSCNEDTYTYLGQCIKCQLPCQVCNSSYDECTSCEQGFYLYNQKCSKVCPETFYPEQGAGLCLRCQSPCMTCISLLNCTSCDSSNPYIYNLTCLSGCPVIAPLAINFICQKCMNNCLNCTDINTCLQCQSDYLLMNDVCVDNCPNNYEPDENYQKCQKKKLIEILKDNFQQSKFVPFPFLIAFFIFGISVVVAKFQFPETFVPGCLAGFGSLIEFSNWILLLYLQIKDQDFTPILINTPQLLITIIALIINAIINIFSFILFQKTMIQDQLFQQWVDESNHSQSSILIQFISFISSHKFLKVFYCKYYGFSFFKAKFSSIQILLPLNILTGISIVVVSFPFLFSAGYSAYFDEQKGQLFITSLDVIIVTTIMFIILICETQKPSDFFEDAVNTNEISLFGKLNNNKKSHKQSFNSEFRHEESNSRLSDVEDKKNQFDYSRNSNLNSSNMQILFEPDDFPQLKKSGVKKYTSSTQNRKVFSQKQNLKFIEEDEQGENPLSVIDKSEIKNYLPIQVTRQDEQSNKFDRYISPRIEQKDKYSPRQEIYSNIQQKQNYSPGIQQQNYKQSPHQKKQQIHQEVPELQAHDLRYPYGQRSQSISFTLSGQKSPTYFRQKYTQDNYYRSHSASSSPRKKNTNNSPTTLKHQQENQEIKKPQKIKINQIMVSEAVIAPKIEDKINKQTQNNKQYRVVTPYSEIQQNNQVNSRNMQKLVIQQEIDFLDSIQKSKLNQKGNQTSKLYDEDVLIDKQEVIQQKVKSYNPEIAEKQFYKDESHHSSKYQQSQKNSNQPYNTNNLNTNYQTAFFDETQVYQAPIQYQQNSDNHKKYYNTFQENQIVDQIISKDNEAVLKNTVAEVRLSTDINQLKQYKDQDNIKRKQNQHQEYPQNNKPYSDRQVEIAYSNQDNYEDINSQNEHLIQQIKKQSFENNQQQSSQSDQANKQQHKIHKQKEIQNTQQISEPAILLEGWNQQNSKLFESEESILTMSYGMMDVNEISPSDFNVLNQRYDDNYYDSKQINEKNNQDRSKSPANRIQSEKHTPTGSGLPQNQIYTQPSGIQNLQYNNEAQGLQNIDVDRIKNLEKMYMTKIEEQMNSKKKNQAISQSKKLHKNIQDNFQDLGKQQKNISDKTYLEDNLN